MERVNNIREINELRNGEHSVVGVLFPVYWGFDAVATLKINVSHQLFLLVNLGAFIFATWPLVLYICLVAEGALFPFVWYAAGTSVLLLYQLFVAVGAFRLSVPQVLS